MMHNSVYGKRTNAGLINNVNKNVIYIKMSNWNEKEAKRLFQILPFDNVLIENPQIRGLKK